MFTRTSKSARYDQPPASYESPQSLDCSMLETHHLCSTAALSTDYSGELSYHEITLDFNSLESRLLHLRQLPASKVVRKAVCGILGSELSHALDLCCEEHSANDQGSASHVDAEHRSTPEDIASERKSIESYLIHSILAADDALSYDASTSSFFRTTLDTHEISNGSSLLLVKQLHRVPSLYESMLVSFLTDSLISKRFSAQNEISSGSLAIA